MQWGSASLSDVDKWSSYADLDELVAYYVTMCKSLLSLVNENTLPLIFTHNKEFSLYDCLLPLALRARDSMARVAVRNMTLTVYAMKFTRVQQHVAQARVSEAYWSELMLKAAQWATDLDNYCTELEDLLYYAGDVLAGGNAELSHLIVRIIEGILLQPIYEQL